MCVYVCVCERERERAMILPMQSMARVNDNILKREKLKKLIRLEKKKRTPSLAEKVDFGLEVMMALFQQV